MPLMDYVISVEAQAIRGEAVRRDKFELAFQDISVNQRAVRLTGSGGQLRRRHVPVRSCPGTANRRWPGGSRSASARRSGFRTRLIEDGQIIKVFDASYHRSHESPDERAFSKTARSRPALDQGSPADGRRRRRTDDGRLEIRHDPRSNVSEAPLQMKSNCGCLLIDDFGRQRIEPAELLNRWIVPLESRHDFLTLSTGKKIQVPFEQLIIFSTNLEPPDLVDEAFLRRIPYKIEIADPDEDEFHYLFELHATSMGIECRPRRRSST